MSRFTLDTNLLRVRNITAFNPVTSEFIQPAQIPVIGDQGIVTWKSSLEFLSSISVPTVSCSVLEILKTVQPGISTMSTIQASTLRSQLVSTVRGLGTSAYVSTTYLENELDMLSMRHGYYISSTTLFDVVSNLSNLTVISGYNGYAGLGPIPVATNGSNLTGGYVYTVNPGKYATYKSSLGCAIGNVAGALAQGEGLAGSVVDIRGYGGLYTNKSRLSIDVITNATLTFSGAGAPAGTAFSTLLYSTGTTQFTVNTITGDPVVYSVPTGATSFSIPMVKFLVQTPQINLANVPTSLTLAYVINAANASLQTNIPIKSGIFVTLDNTD